MEITELEGAILGTVAGNGPCSAYAVRQRFERSPTWGWSSSKGAIYPAVKRLITRNLLTVTPSDDGQRSDQLGIAPDGQQALARWVETITEDMAGAPVDPIRTRINYLFILPPESRRAYLQRVSASVASALKTANDIEFESDSVNGWALSAGRLGLRMQLEAKLKWLQLLLRNGIGDPVGD